MRPQLHATSSRRRRTGSVRALRAIVGTAAVLAIATALAVASAGGSYALWNGAVVTPGSTVTAGTIAAAQSFTASSPATTYNAATSTMTVGMTISNNGNVTAAYSTSTTLGWGSSPALAATIAVVVWKVSGFLNCTPSATPVSPVTGTMAAAPALSGSLAGGASDLYCVRTTIGAVTGIPSTSQVTPTVTSNLTAGNTWTSTAATTFTQTFVDDLAPSVPSSFSSSPTGTTVGLAWQASTDNVGTTGYTITRNGVIIGTSATPSFTDSGPLTPFTNYTYTVTAKDAAGNVSAPASVIVWSGPNTKVSYVVSNSRCVDVSGSSYGSSGSYLVTNNCAGSGQSSQDWKFKWVGSYLTVTSDSTGNVWDVANGSTSAGAAIVSTPGNGSSSQHWQMISLGGTAYQFVNQASGMCVYKTSSGNGKQLAQQVCDTTSSAQSFQVQ